MITDQLCVTLYHKVLNTQSLYKLVLTKRFWKNNFFFLEFLYDNEVKELFQHTDVKTKVLEMIRNLSMMKATSSPGKI